MLLRARDMLKTVLQTGGNLSVDQINDLCGLIEEIESSLGTDRRNLPCSQKNESRRIEII